MRFKLFCISFLLFIYVGYPQSGFQFENSKSKVAIPFKFINNLIIMSLEVNGIPLNFLLDTGVEESILFSLDETDEISFAQIEKVKIKGFGKKEAFDGYKSTLNKIEVNDFHDDNHTLYLVLDQDINISSNVGVPVNGIIGYHFFKNNLVKIDFERNKIVVYKNQKKVQKKIDKSFTKVPLIFNNGKPYLTASIQFENTSQELEAKLLIDTGNSDAVWLFKEKNNLINVPNISVDDYLGRGFSGDVFGFRGRVTTFSINDIVIPKPIIAFPNASETAEIDAIENRLGSIGSEIMRRFTIYFDYQSNFMYLKKNNNFNDDFNFNMSGIDLQHEGLQWVKEAYEDNPSMPSNLLDGNGDKIANNLKYKFELKPIYIITNVRKNSPAEIAGLQKDDLIVKINNRFGYNYTLQDLNQLLKSEEKKRIDIVVDRKGKILNYTFYLKKVL
jgi:PDZ domain/Aspartyl protease